MRLKKNVCAVMALDLFGWTEITLRPHLAHLVKGGAKLSQQKVISLWI